jgi:hypothetical protein
MSTVMTDPTSHARAALAHDLDVGATTSSAALVSQAGTRSANGPSASATTPAVGRIGGSVNLSVADAPRRRRGLAQATDPQGATMLEQTTRTVSRTDLALNVPVGDARQSQLDSLWAITADERVAAMWRGDLTLFQLTSWSSRAQHEVPLHGGEFAYIVMRTPEWAEARDLGSDNVIYLPERSDDRAAA